MFSRANPRSFISPITTIFKRPAMSSAVAVDAGILDDVQYWRRQISPKVPSYWVFTKPMQKSQQDDREYRLIRLDNGLQAVLVHDAKADKAAASLDVAVGHLHDPVSTPFLFPIMGISHTWHSNRLICQDLRISASICYSWCLMFQREKHINLTTYSNREQNNFRRRMSTPRYAISLVLRFI
jgi:hypothetical protein